MVDRDSVDVLFNEHRLTGNYRFRESHNMVIFELFTEFDKILSLDVKIYLIDQKLLQGFTCDWEFEE